MLVFRGRALKTASPVLQLRQQADPAREHHRLISIVKSQVRCGTWSSHQPTAIAVQALHMFAWHRRVRCGLCLCECPVNVLPCCPKRSARVYRHMPRTLTWTDLPSQTWTNTSKRRHLCSAPCNFPRGRPCTTTLYRHAGVAGKL